MKNPTLIAQQRASIRFSAARICDLLKWQPNEYNFFLYQTGVAYLAAYFNNDKDAIGKIETGKEFWSWWKTEWYKRDEVYRNGVDGMEDAIKLTKRVQLYKAVHKVELLICEIAPPRIVYPTNFHTTKMEMACQKQ